MTNESTSGYMHEYDNLYLWMSLKRIIGSPFANYREPYDANRRVAKAMIHPTVSRTFALHDAGETAYQVHRNAHRGKVAVLALAPEPGLGVTSPELRTQHINQINRFQAH